VSLSILTTLATVILTVLFGTPLAYLIARKEFPGKKALDALIDLPIVLPPPSRDRTPRHVREAGSGGPFFSALGMEIPFTPAAVVLAQLSFRPRST